MTAPLGLSLDALAEAIGHAPDQEPYAWLQRQTRQHRAQHGCGAYAFDEGQALIALTRQWKPARVLELGTALGYTACCWADSGASVDTVERDPGHAELAAANIASAGMEAFVSVHTGDFAEVLPELAGGYDIAFFDGLAPTEFLVDSMRDHLSQPGLLVVTNLHLAGPDFIERLVGPSSGTARLINNDLALILIE